MVLNVYKPKGWTSNDVVQKIKRSYGFKKVGHAGTLDPLAEGVLIVLTNEDTKRQSEFMGLEKEYLVKIAFGYESDSHDLGTPLKSAGKEIVNNLSRSVLQDVLRKYIGKIYQQVPAYSAVHVKGQRLYKSARNKQLAATPLPCKEVEIYAIKILSLKSNIVELEVKCGKGTYIRSLVRDIGKDLGCGAVATSLVRTKVGNFMVDNSLTLDEATGLN